MISVSHGNTGEATVTRHGGTVRVTHGEPIVQHEGNKPQELPRTGHHLVRFDGNTGEATVSRGRASYQGTGQPENPSGSVMGSMQLQGGQRTVELEPGNPASRTLLSVAVKAGLVTEASGGVFVDTATYVKPLLGEPARPKASGATGDDQEAPTSQATDSSKANQAADPLEGTVFDKAEYAIWSDNTGSIPDHVYEHAVAGVTAALTTASPEKLEGVARALAEAEGMEPAEAQEIVDTGVEWFAASLSKDLQKSMGMSAAEVDGLYDHLREQGHPRFAEAIQRLVTFGMSDVFREIALEHRIQSNNGSDLSALTKAGFETRVDRQSGEVLVKAGNGGWQPLSKLGR